MTTWGDTDFEQEIDHETEVDENGIKFVIEYRTNDDGKRVRVTKKVRVYKNVKKVSKRVEERRQNWKKFGKCVGSSEVGVTYRAEEVFLVLGEAEKKEKERLEQEKKDKQELESMYNAMIAEGKKPGGPMQTAPASGAPALSAAPVWKPSWQKEGGNAPPSQGGMAAPPGSSGGGDPSVYVPPHKKGGATGSASGAAGADGSEDTTTTTIRVTNLSEETTEADLTKMFSRFGMIPRIYLVRDRVYNTSRGFAFITFATRRDAQRAMDEMDGQGWDHLILSIEWAKPSK